MSAADANTVNPNNRVKNQLLAPYTTMGLGGPATFFEIVHDEEGLFCAQAFAKQQGLPLVILAGGSNVLIADEGLNAVVLQLAFKGHTWLTKDEQKRLLENAASSDLQQPQKEPILAVIKAEAGVLWDDLVQLTVEQGFYDIAAMSGIPGHVGAAVMQNIGAYGQELSDSLLAVEVCTAKGLCQQIAAKDLALSYRSSNLKTLALGQQAPVVISVVLGLRQKKDFVTNHEELGNNLRSKAVTAQTLRQTVLRLRAEKNMLWPPAMQALGNCGSFFTNPIIDTSTYLALKERYGASLPGFRQDSGHWKISAAWLLERLGFVKGYRQGHFGLSPWHALSVVHYGGGSCQELLAFTEAMVQEVSRQSNLQLQREPVLLKTPPQN